MKKNAFLKLNAMIAAFVTLCLFFSSLPASAEDDSVSITILLTDPQKNITAGGVEVSMYKVADFTDYMKHEFTAAEEFEPIISQLDFSNAEKGCTMENAEAVLSFIQENNIPAVSVVVSDENGIADFGEVEKGIYLIDASGSEKYMIRPFLVEAPLYEDGQYYNEVKASPKFLTVTDDSSEPDSSSESTPDSTPDSSVSDSSKPDDSSTPPDHGEKIPQTGQLKWPVPVLAIAGITLIVIGYADRCFRKRDED